jgi:hypothetical protein
MRRISMAKALLGHVGVSPDLRVVEENRRLRRRVEELEVEVGRLRGINEALAARVSVSDDLLQIVPDAEPALA